MSRTDALNQYINVVCEEYALLTDIMHIEQVVMAADAELTKDNKVKWSGKDIPFVDLTEILMGHKQEKNKHCVIMKKGETDEDVDFLAVAVGEVANIQAIQEDEFEALPHLDFPFNHYFDKAYVTKDDKRCIYRLKNLVSIINNAK